MTNAAKYTPEGGQIDQAAAVGDGMLEVTVRDNGLGIPADMLDRVDLVSLQGLLSTNDGSGG